MSYINMDKQGKQICEWYVEIFKAFLVLFFSHQMQSINQPIAKQNISWNFVSNLTYKEDLR